MGSDKYDRYFQQPRPYNRYIFKMLYTDYFGLEKDQKERHDYALQERAKKEWEEMKNSLHVNVPKDLQSRQ